MQTACTAIASEELLRPGRGTGDAARGLVYVKVQAIANVTCGAADVHCSDHVLMHSSTYVCCN